MTIEEFKAMQIERDKQVLLCDLEQRRRAALRDCMNTWRQYVMRQPTPDQRSREVIHDSVYQQLLAEATVEALL